MACSKYFPQARFLSIDCQGKLPEVVFLGASGDRWSISVRRTSISSQGWRADGCESELAYPGNKPWYLSQSQSENFILVLAYNILRICQLSKIQSSSLYDYRRNSVNTKKSQLLGFVSLGLRCWCGFDCYCLKAPRWDRSGRLDIR